MTTKHPDDKFALFVYDMYYPAGALGDIHDFYQTIEAAKSDAVSISENPGCDFWQIVNCETWQVVLEND